MKISKGTIIRTLVLILAFVNHALTIAGKNPLPFDDAMIEQVVAFGFDFVASMAAWWKNNSFTKEAIESDAIMKSNKILNKLGAEAKEEFSNGEGDDNE